MPEKDDPALIKLQNDLKEARQEYNDDYNPAPKEEDENVVVGARAGIELIGATLGGALLGYGIDYLAGTAPLFFIIFLLLGAMTGFYNIYKITSGKGTSVGFGGLKNKPKDGK
jgi:ATP synthase protein I